LNGGGSVSLKTKTISKAKKFERAAKTAQKRASKQVARKAKKSAGL
jgi:hypothetical protein